MDLSRKENMKIVGYYLKDGKPIGIAAVEGKDAQTVIKEAAAAGGFDPTEVKLGDTLPAPDPKPMAGAPATPPAPAPPAPAPALPQLAPEPPKPPAPSNIPAKPAPDPARPKWSAAAKTLVDGCGATACPTPK